MAEALGMSQRAYQSYETRQTLDAGRSAGRLCTAKFGVDLNWILLGVEAVRPGP